jgi:hypothetical protein
MRASKRATARSWPVTTMVVAVLATAGLAGCAHSTDGSVEVTQATASPARSPTSRAMGQGLLVVGQSLLPVPEPGVHQADVVKGGRFAGTEGA